MNESFRTSPFKSYVLDGKTGRAMAKRQATRKMVLIAVPALATMAGMQFFSLASDAGLGFRLLPIGIVVVLLTVYGLAMARHAGGQLGSFSIELSDDLIRRVVQGKPFELSRGEVLRIIEVAGHGLALYTPNRSLFVPCAISGYAEIRSTLAGWMPIESTRRFAVPAEQTAGQAWVRMTLLLVLALIAAVAWVLANLRPPR